MSRWRPRGHRPGDDLRRGRAWRGGEGAAPATARSVMLPPPGRSLAGKSTRHSSWGLARRSWLSSGYGTAPARDARPDRRTHPGGIRGQRRARAQALTRGTIWKRLAMCAARISCMPRPRAQAGTPVGSRRRACRRPPAWRRQHLSRTLRPRVGGEVRLTPVEASAGNRLHAHWRRNIASRVARLRETELWSDQRSLPARGSSGSLRSARPLPVTPRFCTQSIKRQKLLCIICPECPSDRCLTRVGHRSDTTLTRLRHVSDTS
jgi:hypothetical protein